MDFHLWTPLFSSVLALAIAVKVLLRARKRRAHWLFMAFATNVAVWYFATFLEYRGGKGELMGRFTAVMAVLLPQTLVRFLRAFRTDTPNEPGALDRWAARLLFPMLFLVASPWFAQKTLGAVIRAGISAYVVGLLIASVSALYSRGRSTASRQERRRVLYLVGVVVLTTLVTTADLVPFTVNRIVPADLPPVGSLLVLAVLYMFSEVIERRRVIDLYELAGRFVVLTALGLVLAGIYYRLVDWERVATLGHRAEGPYFLNAMVASLVILILFDPLRDKVEAQIAKFFFNERYDLERALSELRNRLAHTLELDAMGRTLMEGLDTSHRVTAAGLYLVDADRRGLDLFAHLGAEPVRRVELAAMRALLDLGRAQGAAVREAIDRELQDRQELGEHREAENLAEVIRGLEALGTGVALPVESDAGDLVGLLTVHDDRVRDAFSSDEVLLLKGLAAQVSIVVENSRLHARIKERDRLAALGEMAAGLAHEIRNPLGAIKAAAQFMEGGLPPDAPQREFVGIIDEEVGRLNRVVSSFLDYARPYRGDPTALDVDAVIARTAQLLKSDLPAGVTLTVTPTTSLPAVRMDPEHLRQVLINLVRNAAEAMKNHGTVSITTSTRGELVELHVRDSGPGIDPAVRRNLFIPFFTTKAQGTGLGLAISQRLVESAGGRIEIRASDATGTTFTVGLPTVVAATASAPPAAPARDDAGLVEQPAR